jgi:hypothetical protein
MALSACAYNLAFKFRVMVFSQIGLSSGCASAEAAEFVDGHTLGDLSRPSDESRANPRKSKSSKRGHDCYQETPCSP